MDCNNDSKHRAVILNGRPLEADTPNSKPKKHRQITVAVVFSVVLFIIILLSNVILRSSADKVQFGGAINKSSPDESAGGEDLTASREALRGTVHYSQMTYRRPETDEIFELIDRIEELWLTESYEDVTSCLDKIYSAYWYFDTMYSLADLRSCIDTSDDFYYQECLFFSENYPILEQKMDKMLCTLAESPLAEKLDSDYYQSDLLKNHTGEFSYSDELVALFQNESELIYEYQALISNPEITVDGTRVQLYDYLYNTYDDSAYYAAVEQYYNEYNGPVGEIYIKLVQTRKQIAEQLGYVSYIDYAYAEFSRDYTPESVGEYIRNVCLGAVPLYKELVESGEMELRYYRDYLSEKENLEALKKSCDEMGGEIQSVFKYMEDYGLYDITASEHKLNNSFQTYLEDWNAPFIMLCATLTEDDYTSLAHEFGHFIDAYVNYNCNVTIDAGEACSQSMEYLAAIYAGAPLSDALYIKMLDTVELYAVQGAYNAFEEAVYMLPEGEITTDNLNRIAHEIFMEYGVSNESYSDYGGRSWIDINHFFSNPFYIVSYIISNDAAYQICCMELESAGEGVNAFIRLADRDWNLTYLENVNAIGLDASLTPSRAAEIIGSLNSFFNK